MTDPLNGDALAPLVGFDPAVFQSEDRKLDGFVLALALFYNDYKMIAWVSHQIDDIDITTEEGQTPTAANGQIAGARLWTSRFAIALMNELLELVREHAAVTNSEAFKRCVAQLSRKSRDAWREIMVAAGQKKHPGTPLGAFFVLVRHSAGFHFSPKALLGGYDEHFFIRRPAGMSEQAYASLGRTMKASRFYFADASVQGYLSRNDQDRSLFNRATEFSGLVNIAVRGVVEAYLRLRNKEVGRTAS